MTEGLSHIRKEDVMHNPIVAHSTITSIVHYRAPKRNRAEAAQ